MKKRLLAVVAGLLSAMLVFVGCGTTSVGLYKSEGDATDVTYASYTDLTTALDGAEIDEETLTENGNIVVEKEVETKTHYGVFNVLDGVYTFPLSLVHSIEIITIEESGDAFKVKYDAEGKECYKIVRASGEVLYENLEAVSFNGSNAVKKAVYEAWTIKKDGFENVEILKYAKGEKTVHYTTDNGVGKTITATDFTWLGEYSAELVDYIWTSRLTSTGTTLYTISNLKGKVIGECEINNNHIKGLALVGKYGFFQNAYEVDQYSSDFDYVEGGKKYELETLRMNLKTGSIKKFKDFGYVFETHMSMGEERAVFEVSKIENKQLNDEVEAFIEPNGKITEIAYPYERIVKLNEELSIAEGNSTYCSTLHIIDLNGEIVVDLSSSDVDYDYVAHCDKFIVLKDADAEKYGMINFAGELVVPFEYDVNHGIVNDVWFASKNTTNADLGLKVKVYYAIDAAGVATVKSEERINEDDVTISNKLGEVEIETLSIINNRLAVVKTNADEVGKYNYALYAYSDFATPLTTFAKLASLNISLHKITESGNAFLVVTSNGIGVLR